MFYTVEYRIVAAEGGGWRPGASDWWAGGRGDPDWVDYTRCCKVKRRQVAGCLNGLPTCFYAEGSLMTRRYFCITCLVFYSDVDRGIFLNNLSS
jgi:hypothetical protein